VLHGDGSKVVHQTSAFIGGKETLHATGSSDFGIKGIVPVAAEAMRSRKVIEVRSEFEQSSVLEAPGSSYFDDDTR